MSSDDILDEVKKVADGYGLAKPDDISDIEWQTATTETKDLLVQIKELHKPLEDAYFEAVEDKNWERALLLYQRLVGVAHLCSINPTIWGEQERRTREFDFIIRAREWVEEVKELLAI